MQFQNINWREFLIRTVLVIGSIVVSVIILEFFLRMTPLVRMLPYTKGIPAYYYQPDREIGYDIAPNFPTTTISFRADGLKTSSYEVWSNELGCFDNAYHGEHPYTLLLGDSFTWGYVQLPDTWGAIVEKETGERVLKCGVAGFGTQQELVKAQRILQTLPPPSTILLAYTTNDIADDANMPNRFVYKGLLIPNLGELRDYDFIEKQMPSIFYNSQNYCMWNTPAHPTIQRIKCFFHSHSIIYLVSVDKIKSLISSDFLRSIGLVNKLPADLMPPPPPDAQKNKDNLIAIANLAKSYGADFKVVLTTSVEMLDTRGPDQFADIKAFLDQEHIKYIDLQKPIQSLTAEGAGLYWPSNYHWNVAGNHLAGLLVSQWLLSQSTMPADTERLKDVTAALLKEFKYSE